jgi:RHS repeat-associated protein
VDTGLTESETWTYDLPSLPPTSWTNRRGTTIRYEYGSPECVHGSNGRVTAKLYPDASRVVYCYDGRGNLALAMDATGTTSLHYDANDRLERITYPGGRHLQYIYNAAGQRASSTNQLGHTLTYGYDDAGRLQGISDETGAEVVRYHYDAIGRLERKDLGNGVYTVYAYDSASQLTSLVNHRPDGGVLSQFEYSYDSRGRRMSMQTLEGLWRYEYDDLGQLTAWTAPGGRHVEYEYDALGNRVLVTDDDVVTSYTTNALNQYIDVGNERYEYDADGNMTQKISPVGVTTYTWDEENRLVSVSSPGGSWTYTYDAFGDRVRLDDNGATIDFVIDPIGLGDVVGEYDGASGALLATYDHGFGLLSRTEAGETPGYYSFDALGSTSEITAATGSEVSAYTNLPFGEMLSQSGMVDSSFQFVGEHGVSGDTTDLLHMRARSYDPLLGRFLSSDPLDVQGGDVNLYRYVANAPTAYTDPSGLTSWEDPGNTFEEVRKQHCWEHHGARVCDPEYNRFVEDRSGLYLPPRLEFGPSAPWTPRWWNPIKNIWNAEVWALCGVFYNPRVCEGQAVPRGRGALGKVKPPIPPTSGGPSHPSQPTRPWDPNDKTCPNGYGTRRLVSGDTVLPYRVSFENWEEATAPAQIVTITDPLSDNLDWSTFELTEIGFGDVRLVVPKGTQHYETSVPMTFNGASFDVQIEAGIHLQSGEVYAYFYSIDPFSGLPPPVDAGFLPPEDGTGRGQGYFSFIVRALEGLSPGTETRNIAHITFNFLETIATNQVDPRDPEQGTDPDKECLLTIADDEATLTTASNVGGVILDPGEATLVYDWGETVTLAAVPDQGYMFVYWSGDVDTVSDVDAASTEITMYDDFSIVANFAGVADFDISGGVDGFDLARLARAFGSVSGDLRYDRVADLSNDGAVDGDDLAILAANFGSSR